MFRHFFDHLCIRYLMYDVFCKDGWVVVAALFFSKTNKEEGVFNASFYEGRSGY